MHSTLQIIGINELKEWQINFTAKQASEYYLISTKKLNAHFDLSLSESAKSLLIDAILLEAIDSYFALKIWKEAKLQTEQLTGVVDHLIAGQGRVYYQSKLLNYCES